MQWGPTTIGNALVLFRVRSTVRAAASMTAGRPSAIGNALVCLESARQLEPPRQEQQGRFPGSKHTRQQWGSVPKTPPWVYAPAKPTQLRRADIQGKIEQENNMHDTKSAAELYYIKLLLRF